MTDPRPQLSPQLRAMIVEAAQAHWCAGVDMDELIASVRPSPSHMARRPAPQWIQDAITAEAHRVIREQYTMLRTLELPLLMDSNPLDRGAPQLPGGRAGRRGLG